VSKLQFSHLKT